MFVFHVGSSALRRVAGMSHTGGGSVQDALLVVGVCVGVLVALAIVCKILSKVLDKWL